MPTREDFERNCKISDSFIDVIDKMTFFKETEFEPWKPDGNYTEISLTPANTDNPLLANVDCQFFGRYYKITEGFYFWIGYDFRKNEDKRFYISFCSVKKADEIKKVLEDLHENYEAEYCGYDKHYWYNVFLDIRLLYLQNNDGIVDEVNDILDKILDKLLGGK